MRIQHNIMAMNAYRNYTNNVNAMKSSLEKLSSGYKINRAGDDAAGLAISEKMRAQITGLETAQKNAKDGISLVQTAEGALTEVHDMLNRMVELATQSANGTYDNTTDRYQLQKEVEELKSEINRIADSSNFNGIKLLDGSMDADGRVANTTTVFANMFRANNVLGAAADGSTAGANSLNKVGGNNDKGGVMLTGQYSNDTTGKLNESDNSVRYHKDAATSGKTSFTVDLDGLGYKIDSGKKVEGLEFKMQGGVAAKMGSGNHISLDKAGTGGEIIYDVTANGEGEITSQAIAKAIYDKIHDNGDVVYVQVGGLQEDGAGGNGAAKWIEYNVTLDGDKLHFEMTDKGYSDACAAANAAATAGTKENYFQGNFNYASVKNDAKYGALATQEAKDIYDGFLAANKDRLVGNTSSCEINEGSTPAGTIYAQAYIRLGDTANNAKGINATSDIVADGKGLKLGDEYYLFAGSDATFNTEYADNVKVVDIRDLEKLVGNATGDPDYDNQLRKALDRLSVAAKDNEMFDVQVEQRGNIIAINERTTYTGGANLTHKDWGLEEQIKSFGSAQSTTEVLKEAGKSLTLQIGDTAEDFNQLSVNIKDIHTDSLGIADLDISTQEGAQAAIDVIKAAINKVSDVRGTLGATQNRLDHTINNLSVMTENIQDAESTIRDTDVAAEMMKYTKNNILIQSAQAMLAQANQVPQGVLQLLQ